MFHFPVFLPSHENFAVHNIAAVKNTPGIMYKLPMEDVLLPNAVLRLSLLFCVWVIPGLILCLKDKYPTQIFVIFLSPFMQMLGCYL
jgi:hypothetical protein